MFVSSYGAPCAKRYGVVVKSKLLRPCHTTYHNNCVITNIKKKNQRLYKPKKQGYIGKRRTNIKNTFSWASAGLTLKTRLE